MSTHPSTDGDLAALYRLRELRSAHHQQLPSRFASGWRCDRPDCDGLPHDGTPFRHARAAQIIPPDPPIGYLVGGRGSGKTWAGAHNFAQLVLDTPPDEGDDHTEWAIVAPTYGDTRDVCIEGPSGLLKALHYGTPDSLVERWDRTYGHLRLTTGALIYADAANEGGQRIQGKNLYGGWCDEVGLWKRWRQTWEESLGFAVRKGPARILCTGTPKRTSLARHLLVELAVWNRQLRTLDNSANLSASQLEALQNRFAGTRLGRQELDGELLEDIEGALWTLAVIEDERSRQPPDNLDRVVIGVDPAVTANANSDETGIIAAAVTGRGIDAHYWILEDRSGRYSPNRWATVVAEMVDDHDADLVVAEVNNGGDLVETALRQVAPNLPIRKVLASRGKQVRAEPIAALYEQHRVHHVGEYPHLEDQMTQWDPTNPRAPSPDRVDALVWAITELAAPSRSRHVVYRNAAA